MVLSDLFNDSRSSRICEKILDAFLCGKGVSYVIDTAAGELKRPILLLDSSNNCIAMNFVFLKKDIQVNRERFEELKDNANPAMYSIHHELADLKHSDEPTFNYSTYFGAAYASIPVIIHNRVLASLILFENGEALSDNETPVIDFLSSILSQELQKSSLYNHNLVVREPLLIDMLNIHDMDSHVLSKRLREQHYELSGKYYIAVLFSLRRILTSSEIAEMYMRLKPVLQDTLCTEYKNRLVILFNCRNQNRLPSETINALREENEVSDTCTGVSNYSTDLTKVYYYYNQAVHISLHANHIHGRTDRLTLFSDYSILDMLEVCQQSTDLREYCNPQILSLIEYDQENHTDFAYTFYVYLKEKEKLTNTARSLFIHKNTLLYRLEKIHSIIHADKFSSDELFQYMLSFKILIFKGLFTPYRNTPDID